MSIPKTSPKSIFELRESAFANDLFITAVSHFDFFNFLKKHPSNIDGICRSLKIKKRPADVMLTLFKAYGFVKEEDGKYCLSDTSVYYLTEGSRFDLSSYVSSLEGRPTVEEMKKVLMTGKPANWAAVKKLANWKDSMEHIGFARSYTAGMNSRGAYLANGLADAVDLEKYNKILDIGGGSGIYSAVLLNKNLKMTAAVYEKTPVDKVARYSINGFGLNKRMDVIQGDMFNKNLPGGYDVHLLSHVIHDWDFNEVEKISKKSFNSLDPGGLVVIHDAHINENKTGPLSVAEYSVLLMFLTEGKCYSIAEIKGVLDKAGFRNIEYIPTILNRSIITGLKPG
jgi:protein-L-isoaspartate O-methyltransferase